MEVTRRAVVLAAGPCDLAGKLRPALVVQSDLFNAYHGSVTLLPVTRQVSVNTMFRVLLPAGAETGLQVESEAQVDKVQSLRRHRIVRVLGHVSPLVMERVDEALRRWLAL